MIQDAEILIVGGAGFVGSNLAKMLLSFSRKIHIIDNLLSSERFNIPISPKITFTEGSISEDQVLGSLMDEYDYVFHLATYHGNQSSIHDPLADHQNNTLTTLKLFERLKTFKRLKKVVYSSAGCSVAEKTFAEAKPSKEVDIVSLDMDSPYSISKIIGEFYSKYYFKQHQLPVVRVRFQNVFGPGEILGAGKWRGTPATIWRNVTPTFIYRALKEMPLPLENNGVATRDFIYVDDICRGLIQAAFLGKAGDVYNLASGKEISIRNLAEMIVQMTGNKIQLEYLPKRNWDHSGKRFGCPEKAEQEIQFKAQIEMAEGLKQTIDWTLRNLEIIDRTILQHKEHYSVSLS